MDSRRTLFIKLKKKLTFERVISMLLLFCFFFSLILWSQNPAVNRLLRGDSSKSRVLGAVDDQTGSSNIPLPSPKASVGETNSQNVSERLQTQTEDLFSRLKKQLVDLSSRLQTPLQFTSNQPPTSNSLLTSPTPTPSSTAPSAPSSSPTTSILETSVSLPFADSFESGLASWRTSGDVSLIQQKVNPDGIQKPFQGQNMVRIGVPVNPGRPLSENELSLIIPKETKKLTLFYSLFSYDYVGFDSPAFQIAIDGTSIFSLSAKDLDKESPQTTTEKLDSTPWRKLEIQIPELATNQSTSNSTTRKLTISAGNDELNLDGPTQHQSWVYIDSIQIE